MVHNQPESKKKPNPPEETRMPTAADAAVAASNLLPQELVTAVVAQEAAQAAHEVTKVAPPTQELLVEKTAELMSNGKRNINESASEP